MLQIFDIIGNENVHYKNNELKLLFYVTVEDISVT